MTVTLLHFATGLCPGLCQPLSFVAMASYRELDKYVRRRDFPACTRRRLRMEAKDEGVSLFCLAVTLACDGDVHEDHDAHDALTDIELALLFMHAARWRMGHVPLLSGRLTGCSPHLDLRAWDNPVHFAETFRVSSPAELERLAAALGMPERICIPPANYIVSGLDALAVLLGRLAFPCRLCDLRQRLRLDWSLSKFSHTINATVRFLNARFGARVLFDDAVLSRAETCRKFAETIARKAREIAVANGRQPYTYVSCIGFVDGTDIRIARPTGPYQGPYYNGHHR